MLGYIIIVLFGTWEQTSHQQAQSAHVIPGAVPTVSFKCFVQNENVTGNICFLFTENSAMGVKMLQCFPFYRRCKDRCKSKQCPPAAGERNYTTKLNTLDFRLNPDYSHHRAHFSHCRNKAAPVPHHVMEQWQRWRAKPESELPDLFLQQSPPVLSAPDGQQHQRSRCNLLSGLGGWSGLQSLLLLICSQIPQWRIGNNRWKRLHIRGVQNQCISSHPRCIHLWTTPSRIHQSGLFFAVGDNRLVYSIHNPKVHYFVNFCFFF